MAVPPFHQFIRPALEVLSDNQPKHWMQVADAVAPMLCLMPSDLEERTRGGSRTLVSDRVQWALTYLRQAGLVESEKKGTNRITAAGKEYLDRAPNPIKPHDLLEFPSYMDFQSRHRPANGKGVRSPSEAVHVNTALTEDIRTPTEIIEEAHTELKKSLGQDILERVKALPPPVFEKLVVDLMVQLGYGGSRADAGKTLGRTGDGGVDGVINEDVLGLDKIYLQAKRWSSSVGAPQLRDFVGSLIGKNSEKGVFITTSSFTGDAVQYVQTVNRHIALIDGSKLAEMMIDHGLGVVVERTYEVKRIDSDYFDLL